MSRLNCSSASDEDEFYGPMTAREIELDWRRLMAEKNKKREEAQVPPEQSKPIAGEEEKTISIAEKLDPLPKLSVNDNSIRFIDEDDSTMDVGVEAETFSKAPLSVTEFNNGLETVEHMDHCEGMDEVEIPMRAETADKSLISVKGDNHYEVYIPFSPPSKKSILSFTHSMDEKNFHAFDLTSNIVDELKINCSTTVDLTTDMHDNSKIDLTCNLLDESKINSSSVVDLTIDVVDELKINCSTIDLTTDMLDNSMIHLTGNIFEESKGNCSAAVDTTINALDKAKINSSTVVDITTEIVDESKINCLTAVDITSDMHDESKINSSIVVDITTEIVDESKINCLTAVDITSDMHDESKINSSIVVDITTEIVDELKINCSTAVDYNEVTCAKSILEDTDQKAICAANQLDSMHIDSYGMSTTSVVMVSSNNVGFIASEEVNKTNPVSESDISEQNNDSVLDVSLNLSKSNSFSLNRSKYMHLLSSDTDSSFVSTNEDVLVDTLSKPEENANILDFEVSSKEKEESFQTKEISEHKTEEVIQKLEKTMLTVDTPLAQPAIEMCVSTTEFSICSNKSMDCNSAEEEVSIVTDHIMINAAEEITRKDVNSFINSDSGGSSEKSFSSLPNEEISRENKQNDGISYSPPGKKQCFTNKENDDPKRRIPILSAHKLPVVKPAILTVDNIVKSTPWASDFKRKKIPQPKKPSYIVSPNKLDLLLKTTPVNKPIRPHTADSSVNKTPLMPLQQNSRVFSTPNVMAALKLKTPTPIKQIPVLVKNKAATAIQLKTPPKNPKFKDVASPVAEYIKNPTTIIRNVTPTRKCSEIPSENFHVKAKTTPKPDFALTAKYYSSADRCFVKPSSIKSPVLPKMGERQTGILVTPKPQVLKHLGRVKSDENSGEDRLGLMKPGRRTSLSSTSFANLRPSSMDLDMSVIQKQ